MRPQIVIILTFLLGLWSNSVVLAQSSVDSQNPPAPDSQRTGPQFPIDDWILPLLIVGIAYGCFIMYRRNRLSSTPE